MVDGVDGVFTVNEFCKEMLLFGSGNEFDIVWVERQKNYKNRGISN